MRRRKLVAANWKMYKTVAEAEAFVLELRTVVEGFPDCDIVLFPAFFSLGPVAQALEGTRIAVGAQDIFWESEGAYTGEVSGAMIQDVGGLYVLLGHSERRHVIGEANTVVSRKLGAALASGLIPVFCVGEKLAHRRSGEAHSYVAAQLMSLSELNASELSRVVIAYEPVWAIGTGETATPEDADSMHAFIREWVRDRFDDDVAAGMRILYGGSVKPGNAESLLGKPHIDGALIGGAGLEVESFAAIIRAVAP